MRVADLRKELENYNDDAEVIVVDFANGCTHYEATVGSDDEDEGAEYCRIGWG